MLQVGKYVDINLYMATALMPRAIRQHHPAVNRVQVLAVHDAYLCTAVQCAARKLAQHFDRMLAPLKLTNGQFSMLSLIVGMETTTVGDLSGKLAMEHSTVSAAAKTLRRRGLISAEPGKSDKRQQIISATAAGRVLAAMALPIWRHEHHALLAELGPDVMNSFLFNLPRIRTE